MQNYTKEDQKETFVGQRLLDKDNNRISTASNDVLDNRENITNFVSQQDLIISITMFETTDQALIIHKKKGSRWPALHYTHIPKHWPCTNK